MFKRKQKEKTYINIYDAAWNDIVNRRYEIERGMDELYLDIQHSLSVLSCFEKNSPNWKAENDHVGQLRYSLLCKCGAYDNTSYELRNFWNDHKDELQRQFCLSYDVIFPLKDCNGYLRLLAKEHLRGKF